MSGDMEEGVKEEVSDALPLGGRLDQGGRPDGLRVPGGAAVPLRGCVRRRVRPVRWLVVRDVMGEVVWVWGGGRRCRVWALVMGFSLVAAG